MAARRSRRSEPDPSCAPLPRTKPGPAVARRSTGEMGYLAPEIRTAGSSVLPPDGACPAEGPQLRLWTRQGMLLSVSRGILLRLTPPSEKLRARRGGRSGGWRPKGQLSTGFWIGSVSYVHHRASGSSAWWRRVGHLRERAVSAETAAALLPWTAGPPTCSVGTFNRGLFSYGRCSRFNRSSTDADDYVGPAPTRACGFRMALCGADHNQRRRRHHGCHRSRVAVGEETDRANDKRARDVRGPRRHAVGRPGTA